MWATLALNGLKITKKCLAGHVMIKILKQMETLNKLSSFLVNFYLLELLVLYIERERQRERERERESIFEVTFKHIMIWQILSSVRR